MNWRTLAGTGVVTLVSLALLGILANFGLGNELLRSSEMQVGAFLSLGVVLVGLAVFAAVGRPWRRWRRTPYW